VSRIATSALILSAIGSGCDQTSTNDGDDGKGPDGSVDGAGANGSGATGSETAAGGGWVVVPGSGGNSLGGAEGCADSSGTADFLPANLLFVVDKSGSMKCNPPPYDSECLEPKKVDDSQLSKWEITQQALTGDDGALAILQGQEGTSVGLITFPLDDHCEVPGDGEVTVPIKSLGATHFTSLQTGLTVEPDGQTPLAGAAIRGLEAIRRGIHSGELSGNNYLVVMTDGAETCQEGALETLLTFVDEARQVYGIRTYAIGAPGSEDSRALLSEIAYRGGTSKNDACSRDPQDASEACHIDLTESLNFEADLGAEFQGITEATSRCEFEVPQDALIDLSTVNVQLTPGDGGDEVVIGRDTREEGKAQCEGAEGWQFSDDETQIVLCGQICDDYLSDFGAQVRVVFGCKPTIIK
jgi:hypothetical protein